MKSRNMNLLGGLPRIFLGRQRSGASTPEGIGAGTTAHHHSDPHVRKPHTTLADLHRGDSGTIQSIGGTSTARLHLMEMGLTPGTRVRVVRLAVFGGPLDIQVRGYRLSLRREEARAILLQPSHS